MHAILRILNEDIRLECAPGEQRRLEDLADALERRLACFSGDTRGNRRLVLAALALLDEAQAANAALARAHCEIDRLNDIVADAALPLDNRGRVNVLRA
jgi:cell division protein ZapA (FtsZ GTPase activity inhibitor)